MSEGPRQRSLFRQPPAPFKAPPMCYIDAMIFKGLAIAVIPLAVVLLAPAQVPLSTPATHHPASGQQAQSPYPSPQAQPKPDSNGVPGGEQQPMIITLPAPKAIPWLLHEKILWAAYVVLAILGYAGIMLALATLKKIERHTEAFEGSMEAVQAIAGTAATAAETAATAAGTAATVAETAAKTAAAASTTAATTAAAALETAQAALLQAQTIVNAERPWVLVTAEPAPGFESSFEITATNRGRSPARVTAALDRVLFAIDEAHLPEVPELKPVETGKRFVPTILLPGESATLKIFSRDDARGYCDSDEMFKSIESWDQKIFLVGKVTYSNLIAAAGSEEHQTNWCCWYIHGKQRSALVPAGGAAYNAHT